MAEVDFYSLTPEQYSSIANKDNDALYFLTNGEIYKGDTLLSNNIVIIPDSENYPETGKDNTLYAKESGESAFWNGSSYTLISRSIMVELEDLEERINETINSIIDIKGFIERTITSIDNENLTSIGVYAFYSCTGLESISLPNVTSIGSYAFYGCSSLTTVNCPIVSTIGVYAFNGCTGLESISLPNVTTISSSSFRNCTSLTSISSTNFPNLTDIGNDSFSGCTSLTSVDFPNATSVGDSAFSGCSSLATVNLPKVTTISSNSFRNCSNLTKIIIGTDISDTCTLKGTSAFSYTPIASGSGYIYVSDDKVDTYKSASNWSTYSAQIKSVNELS